MNRTPSFVDKVDRQLRQYQLEKLLRREEIQSGKVSIQEKQAKDTLIQLDDQNDITRNSEEQVCVGRWSSYRVPHKVQDRLSLNKKSKKNIAPSYRYMDPTDCRGFPTIFRSQRAIPKLKVMLHQLECPLDIETDRGAGKPRAMSQNNKMKNYAGPQALVISNKQEIKPTLKSQRRTVTTITTNEFLQNVENKRPPSSVMGQQGSNAYQKRKKSFGNPSNGQVYQKQILSQLIKQNVGKNQINETNTPLSSMMNYFTMSSNDTKKKVTSKLGLDRLLS